MVIRGSLSTGFRAPTLHQIYAQSIQASFAGGTIVSSGLFNNNSAQARLLGIPKLTPEKSNNITLGVGFNPSKDLNLTFDFYNITIKDRIVYSSSITTKDDKTELYLSLIHIFPFPFCLSKQIPGFSNLEIRFSLDCIQ